MAEQGSSGVTSGRKRRWDEIKAAKGFAFLSESVGLAGLLLAVAALVTSGSLAQTILAAALVVLSAVALTMCYVLQGRLLLQERELGRKSRHADAAPLFANAAAAVSQAVTAAGDPATHGSFTELTGEVVRSVARAFEVAAGRPCRAALVELYSAPTGYGSEVAPAVRAIARSHEVERSQRGTARLDWVGDNTDFFEIMNSGSSYYFNNDLPAAVASGYRNSHWSEDMIKRKAYPYRATVVWPIRGLPSVAAMHPSPQLLGFLCVDSPREGTFDEVLDVPTGEVFAHAMYSALRLYRETQAPTQPVAEPDGGAR
jgi:hypothetical protein